MAAPSLYTRGKLPACCPATAFGLPPGCAWWHDCLSIPKISLCFKHIRCPWMLCIRPL